MENYDIKCESCSNESTSRINVMRFIERLDRYFENGDLTGAKSHLDFWENEARKINDEYGLISVLNEKIGFSRRIKDRDMAESSLKEAKELLIKNDQLEGSSGATVCVNIATTLKAFGHPLDALEVYEKAEEIFRKRDNLNSYEYASLLNNKSSSLMNLDRYDEAEVLLHKAIEVLENVGNYDGEIGLSYISLAHLTWDRDDDVTKVEYYLDKAVEMLDSKNQTNLSNYAYTLEKCIPSLHYFKREEAADRFEQIKNEIYKR